MMRLKTVGRRSGRERHAILGYFEDGPNLITMAMNGWGEPEPAWWLNLQADPDTTVELADGPRAVRGRAATPEERPRLWARWAEYDGEEARELGGAPFAGNRCRHPRATHRAAASGLTDAERQSEASHGYGDQSLAVNVSMRSWHESDTTSSLKASPSWLHR